MSVKLSVNSEIARLEAIVISPPGPEFDLMVPANLESLRADGGGRYHPNPDYLLFDDLVLLDQLQREHARLEAVLRAVVGERVIRFRELLTGVLDDRGTREHLIDEALEIDRELYGTADAAVAEARAELRDLPVLDLAEALVRGRAPYGERRLFRWPLPNHLFARDLAAVVGDAVVFTYAARPARRREFLLSRAIFTHHPLFHDVAPVDIGDAGEPIRGPEGPIATIEGGDVQVLSPEVVLVGIGERTTFLGAERLAQRLFDRGVEVVVACEMPARRAAMHIDTLFTRIDEERCLIYPPMAESGAELGIRVHRLTPSGREDVGHDLLSALRDCGVDLSPVPCGGSDPIHQAREQWSDGANAFALAPGVIVCYGRNTHTLRQLNRAGYRVVTPEEFVVNAEFHIAHGDHVAVALPGFELVRGRGGPRCLTMPLRRTLPPGA